MEAYRILARNGGEVTSQNLKLWEREAKKHRGCHPSEVADLVSSVGLTIAAPDQQTIKRIRSRQETLPYLKALEARFLRNKKSLRGKLKREREKSINLDKYLEGAKSRKRKMVVEKGGVKNGRLDKYK